MANKEQLLEIVQRRMAVLEDKDSLTNAETTQAIFGLELIDRLTLGMFVTIFEVNSFLAISK